MRHYKRILAVVDPHAETHPAVDKAAALARRSSARLDLLICNYNDHLAGTRFGDSEDLRNSRRELMDSAEAELEKLAGPLREDGLDVGVHAVFHYPLYDGIIAKADELKPDIIVKDTHYHHLLKRSVFSNTDWELIRLSPYNLLLAKAEEWGEQPAILAAVDPLHIGDKPASLDHTILDQAVSLTELLGGKLQVVHCYPVSVPAAVAGAGMAMPASVDAESLHACLEKSHRMALDKLVNRHNIAAEAVFLVPGEPRRRLVDMARTLDADIMVVGAVSRSRVKQAFLGFTALHILDRLPCDLVIEKPART